MIVSLRVLEKGDSNDVCGLVIGINKSTYPRGGAEQAYQHSLCSG